MQIKSVRTSRIWKACWVHTHSFRLGSLTLIAAPTLTSINGHNPSRSVRYDCLDRDQGRHPTNRQDRGRSRPGAHIVGRDVLAVAPLFSATQRDGQLQLAAGGSWTAPHAAEVETLVESLAAQSFPAHDAAIDMQGVRRSTPMVHGCCDA